MGNSQKGFWLSFFLTLAVLLPLGTCVVMWSGWQNRTQSAGQTETAVPITAVSRRTMTLLLASAPAGEEDAPGFVLCKCSCLSDEISICALPGETVLSAPGGAVTLAASYRAAGPARAAELLAQSLGAAQPDYLAATPAGWATLLPGPARVDISALLPEPRRNALGISDPVIQLDAESAAALLTEVTQVIPVQARQTQNGLRGAVWAAFVRQNMAALPSFSAAVRAQSGNLLTSLSAAALLRLEETLSYLAAHDAAVQILQLPGSWAGARFELNEESMLFAQELLGAA